jgi:enediyne biosynthesis protein E4
VMDTIEISEPHLHYREPPMLLWNSQGKRFVDVSSRSGDVFSERWAGRGLASGDINNDGREDVVITSNNGPAWVLLNEMETRNHWITLKLVGVRSNRDAIGARVKISTAEGEQYATVTTAGSYQSSSDKRVHFGLGSATQIAQIEIAWPSGIHQAVNDVKADQILTVTEPSAAAN